MVTFLREGVMTGPKAGRCSGRSRPKASNCCNGDATPAGRMCGITHSLTIASLAACNVAFGRTDLRSTVCFCRSIPPRAVSGSRLAPVSAPARNHVQRRIDRVVAPEIRDGVVAALKRVIVVDDDE